MWNAPGRARRASMSLLALATAGLAVMASATAALAAPSTTIVTPATPSTTIVTPADLHYGGSSWFFYDDSGDIAHTTQDPSHYAFVSGPGTPPSGTASVRFHDDIGPKQRWNMATTMLGGTKLADLTELLFNTYSENSGKSIFLTFDVDFHTAAWSGYAPWGGYQGRLSFDPTGLVANTWQESNAVAAGAMWTWSWRDSSHNPNRGTWPDGSTASARTWADILAQFPDATVRAVTDQNRLLFRAGTPYTDGFTGYLDKVTIGVSGTSTIYDFELPAPAVAPVGGAPALTVPSVESLTPATGTAGTPVVIAGHGFNDVSEVLFGKVPATFTVDGFGRITAIVPAGAGTVDVHVVNPAGTSRTVAGDRFRNATVPTSHVLGETVSRRYDLGPLGSPLRSGAFSPGGTRLGFLDKFLEQGSAIYGLDISFYRGGGGARAAKVHRPIHISSRRVRSRKAGEVNVTFRLSKRARRLLARHAKARLVVRTHFVSAATGHAFNSRRSLTAKRRPTHRRPAA